MKLILKGSPLSTNQVYRSANQGGRCIRYMTTKARTRKNEYIIQAIQQWKGIEEITTDINMTIKLYFGDRRKRDVDNYNKLILDSMEGICYSNDVQIQKLSITKAYDKKKPRAEIKITG